jgi:L-rhamnose mutarotase
MKATLFLLFFAAVATILPVATARAADTRTFELRVYTATAGKLEDLHARFRDHTLALFEKHGITNIGYWTPLENPDNKLFYVLAYPSREAREAAWKAFQADPDWKAAKAASEKGGTLVAKVESSFLQATDFSPEVKPTNAAPRVFELRTYTTTPNNLDRLLKRFREHTVSLFQKHGMTNVVYWTLQRDQPAAENTLVYLLAHKSTEAAAESFKSFRADPEWVEARTASEKEGGGSLTVPNGVKSVFMQATDYSPTK